MTETILDRIAAYKRREVAERKAMVSQDLIERALRHAPPTRGFAKALEARSTNGGIALIAEIKKASPSKGLIRTDFDPSSLARAYEAGGATCLSVLTDAPSFKGHEGDFVAARAQVALPVIRKEFLVDRWQVAESRAMGADGILVIMAMVDDALARALVDDAQALGMDVLVEVHDEAELDRALGLGSTLLGVNNRNLHTFETRLETTEQLARRVPSSHLLVAESGIVTHDDVRRLQAAGARAFLVGESLMRETDVEQATRRLLGSVNGEGHS